MLKIMKYNVVMLLLHLLLNAVINALNSNDNINAVKR